MPLLKRDYRLVFSITGKELRLFLAFACKENADEEIILIITLHIKKNLFQKGCHKVLQYDIYFEI